jgi:pimeloyl-ACP methyl ester carboxylesterase
MASIEAAIPIVFLHGFATNTQRTWKEPGWFDLVKEGGRRPVGIDLLGHGDADKPHDPDAYATLVDNVIAELPVDPNGESKLGFQRQLDICGYSMGAMTALEIAIRYPSLVRKLVLAGVGENVIGGGRRPNEGAVDEDTGLDDVGYRFQGMFNQPGNDPLALAALSEYRSRRTGPRIFTPETLATVQADCLIVIGDEDFVGRPEPLAELLPSVETVILPGVDHFGLPKQFGFIDAALEFLGAVPDW